MLKQILKVKLVNRVSRTIRTLRELGPLILNIENLGSFPTKWFQLPEWPDSVGQLEPPCPTIGTTLSDNWSHLVRQSKSLAGVISAYLGIKVKSQESKVQSPESRIQSQETRVKSQESRNKFLTVMRLLVIAVVS